MLDTQGFRRTGKRLFFIFYLFFCTKIKLKKIGDSNLPEGVEVFARKKEYTRAREAGNLLVSSDASQDICDRLDL